MPKDKSKRQTRFLLSADSPLTGDQKSKLKSELHSGAVHVVQMTREQKKRRRTYHVT